MIKRTVKMDAYIQQISEHLEKIKRIEKEGFDGSDVILIKSRLDALGTSIEVDVIEAVLRGDRVALKEKVKDQILNIYQTFVDVNQVGLGSVDDFLRTYELLGGDVSSWDEALKDELAKCLNSVDALDEHPLVKGCLFHYQIEILAYPGYEALRLGRLWHWMCLSQYDARFVDTALKVQIAKVQERYEALLASSAPDAEALFVEFMLGITEVMLQELI